MYAFFFYRKSKYLTLSPPADSLKPWTALTSPSPWFHQLMGKSPLQLEQSRESTEPQKARHQRREGKFTVWRRRRGGRVPRTTRGSWGTQQSKAGVLGTAAGIFSLPYHNSRVWRLQWEDCDI